MPVKAPDRNLALELVRTTEAAALAASHWVGRNQKEKADEAAVDAMRLVLDEVVCDGVVVVGEGVKDEAPMLFNGERIGAGNGGPLVDIAVDPIDGTTLTAKGMGGALSVIAMSDRGTMFDPGSSVYIEKLAVGPDAAHIIDITRPIDENIGNVAEALKMDIVKMTVAILDRERHEEQIELARGCGARVLLLLHGDVAPGLEAAQPDGGINMLWGVGGSPEGVILAAGLKCFGGGMQARLWPRDDAERQAILAEGNDPDRVLGLNDLVAGENAFFAATGITNGSFLRGVRLTPTGAITDSIVARSRSGTSRTIEAHHNQAKLQLIAPILFQ